MSKARSVPAEVPDVADADCLVRRMCSFYLPEQYDMANSLGHQMYRLMVAMRREIEFRMGQLGLTDAQWKPLWVLNRGEVRTSFELAREMEIDAGAMTRMLDRIEAKGLIERVRSETDRRVVNIALTKEGEKVTAQVPAVLAEVNNLFLDGFSEEEWMQMCAFVARMQANGAGIRSAADAAAVKGGNDA